MVTKLDVIKDNKMKNYIYEPMWSQELEDIIENDKAKPLIMEMFYKHGFRVYDVVRTNRLVGEVDEEGNIHEATRTHYKFMLTLDGLPYCQVYVDDTTKDKPSYCYFSPHYQKERGQDNVDRHTVRSAKISGLMRMLDKYECVVDNPEEVIGTDAMYYIPSIAHQVILKDSNHIGKPDFSSVQQYRVLKAYMTGTKLTVERHEEVKNIFDIWSKSVETERHAVEKVQSMFGKDFYILGETVGEGLCVGKARFKYEDGSWGRNPPFEVTDAFQRVRTLDELEGHDDLKAMVTMFKIWRDANTPPHYLTKNKIVSRDTGYVKDLELVISSVHRGYQFEPFNMQLLAIPIENN